MEVLFWVGCAAAFNPRLQNIAKAFSEIMDKADVDYAVLGTKERCTGDIARRLGDEALFQDLAQHNIKTLDEHGVEVIVTTCPHCFNMFKNEYPPLGGNYQVMHYTTYILQLIKDGRLKVSAAKANEIITYHDPCYLGRQNGVYDEPRDILTMLGFQIDEMDRNKEKSFCCGAGGGTMFETKSFGEKINNQRAEEAFRTKANATMTSCPFCLLMMEEAIDSLNQSNQRNMATQDIAEVVNDLVVKGE